MQRKSRVRVEIIHGIRVTMHFSLMLQDQTIIDSTFDKEPANFCVGDGNLLPGFEKVLIGLAIGEEEVFEIEPQEAFGQYNDQNIQRLEKASFDDDNLEVGSVYSFENGGGELPGVIINIDDKFASVDFNHPLAGKLILFKVKILNIENGDAADAN